MKRINVMSIIYLLIWGVPLLIFARDFFFLDEILYELTDGVFELFLMSMKQGLISSILALLIAIPPSYYVTYNNNKLSQMIEGTIFIPFFFPVISTVVSFSLIFTSEIFSKVEILYTLKAIVIANIFYNVPIFIKYLSQGMKKIPKEVIEASKVCGANKLDIFFKIKLPLIKPQLLRGSFLVFVYCFTSFGIVMSLGGLRYSTMEVDIATTLMTTFNFSRVFALGVVQFLLLTIINILVERVETYELHGEEVSGTTGIKTLAFSVVFLILQYMIVGSSIVFSFYNYYKKVFSIDSFLRILSKEFNADYPVIKSIFNSLGIASISALIVIVFTYLLLRNYKKFNTYIIFSTFGISAAFLAITLVYLNILYDISYNILIIMGYLLVTIPVAYSFMYQYIKKFPKDVTEAAKVDGANFIQRFIYVEFPMLREVLIGTYLQIFAIIYGEFTITYTMQLGDDLPLASIINHRLVSDRLFLEGSAMSTLNVMIIGGLFLISTYYSRKKNDKT